MTPLLLICLALLAVYALYMAARVARLGAAPDSFLDAGRSLPGWAVMFLLPGLALSALGVERHLGLVARYGLQASHVAVGLVLVAMVALLVWNRVWNAARVAGFATPGEALGQAYGSVALRLVVLALTLLFALPFAADILSFAAMLVERATGGAIPRVAGVWIMALALAIPAIVGGWRATVLALALQSILLLALLPGVTALAELLLDGTGFPAAPIPVAEGVLWDRIPGVVQYAAGIGKEVSPLGLFSAAAIASNALALTGIVLCPAALYLAQTTRSGRTLGTSAVWLTAMLLAGALVFCAPILASRMADGPVALAGALYAIEPLAGVALLLLMLIGTQLLVGFLVTGGAILVTRDVVLKYLLPHLSAGNRRLSARIAIGFAFFFMALMAAFLPLVSAVLGSVALPLAVQLLPALLGLAFVRWIGRGAVLAGLIIGALIVIFTEPLGLILFEGLFLDLPWGRWPLTIHSAAWGLAFNLLIVLLSATATQITPDRFDRDRLHDALLAATGLKVASGRGLLWTCVLLWAFLGYGPGALLGNSFFSEPIFTKLSAQLGIPSLWVWQLLFWLFGVVLVWWLAARVGFGRLAEPSFPPIALAADTDPRTPDWLAEGLRRIRGTGTRPAVDRRGKVDLIRPAGPPERRGATGSGS